MSPSASISNGYFIFVSARWEFSSLVGASGFSVWSARRDFQSGRRVGILQYGIGTVLYSRSLWSARRDFQKFKILYYHTVVQYVLPPADAGASYVLNAKAIQF